MAVLRHLVLTACQRISYETSADSNANAASASALLPGNTETRGLNISLLVMANGLTEQLCGDSGALGNF